MSATRCLGASAISAHARHPRGHLELLIYTGDPAIEIRQQREPALALITPQ